jgi:hypothetical protein
VEASVPEPQAVSLALPRDLAGRLTHVVENVEQLVHAISGFRLQAAGFSHQGGYYATVRCITTQIREPC